MECIPMFKLPESLHFNKPFHSFIIPCRVVSLMGCIIHIASLDRVLMDIIDPGYHHSICLHKFGLVSFFPYLAGCCFARSISGDMERGRLSTLSIICISDKCRCRFLLHSAQYSIVFHRRINSSDSSVTSSSFSVFPNKFLG